MWVFVISLVPHPSHYAWCFFHIPDVISGTQARIFACYCKNNNIWQASSRAEYLLSTVKIISVIAMEGIEPDTGISPWRV